MVEVNVVDTIVWFELYFSSLVVKYLLFMYNNATYIGEKLADNIKYRNKMDVISPSCFHEHEILCVYWFIIPITGKNKI